MPAAEKRCRPATAAITNPSSRCSSGLLAEVAADRQLSKPQRSSTSLVPSSPRSNVDLRTEAKPILIGQSRHQKHK